ncbi:MAG: SRPBCC family protein [Nitrosomonadales bacterium]|nr:SRPBCC family protein [Nitrosomonadales bacterium]
MLKTIAIVVVVAILTVLIYAATLPNSLHIERSIKIKAAPQKIFALINDFHRWEEWTPYNKDQAMKKTYSGSADGTGARYAWEGNKEVGKGEITIIESASPSRIALDLHMIEPFEARNHVVFALKAEGDSTTVSWIMEGAQTYFVKVMGVFFNMDKMVGKDFEAGLARLKALAEK